MGCLVACVTKIAIQAGLKTPSFTIGDMANRLNAVGGFEPDGSLRLYKPGEVVPGLSYSGTLLAPEQGPYKPADKNEQLLNWIRDGYHLIFHVRNQWASPAIPGGNHYVVADEALSQRNGTIYIMDSGNIATLASFGDFYGVYAYRGGQTATYDNEPPTITDSAKISAVSTTGFTISAGAADNIGITSVWADVWLYGQDTASPPKRIDGYMQSGRAVVQIKTEDFDGFRGDYYIKLRVKDAIGNQANLDDIEKICLYPVNAQRTGNYNLLGGTIRSAPSDAPVNGKDTYVGDVGVLTDVSVVGEYADENGQNWLYTVDGNWVKSDMAFWKIWDLDLYELLKNFFQRTAVYIIAGQPVIVSGGVQLYATAPGNGSYALVHGVSYSIPASYSGGAAPTVTFDTVSFNPNGGWCGPASTRYVHGKAYGNLPAPSRFGYSFDGWFTDPEVGTLVSSGDICLSSQTLYAHWTRIVLLQGSCGDELNYILWGDGLLELTGTWEATGEMSSHPWTTNYAERIYEVILPDGLTNICNEAFSGCKYLSIIRMPDTLTSIGSSAFYNCTNLKSIELPDSITSIGDEAFRNSGLTSLTLPKYVQTLGYGILQGNTGVKSIFVPKTVTSMRSSNSVTCYDSYHTSSSYGHGTYIGSFGDSALETAVIEDGTKTVFSYEFSNCEQLTSVKIPDSVMSIGGYAFNHCRKLPEVQLPGSLTSIGEHTFAYCDVLTQINLPDGLTSIGSYFLNRTPGVTSLTIPKSVTTMSYALSSSSVRTVNVTYGATSIPENAYSGCTTLTSIMIPDTVTSIGNSAFYNCLYLKSIELPDSITSIGDMAFANSGLTSLTLPKYVQTLGCGIIRGNTGVKSIFVPKTVTSMRSSNSVTCYDSYHTSSSYGHGTYIGSFGDSALETAVIEDGTKTVFSYEFSNCEKLVSVTIPDSVTSIGSYAFNHCRKLPEVQLPGSLTSIGAEAFRYCDILEQINLPEGLTTIGAYAFSRSGLTSIQMPDSLKTVGDHVFSYTNLVSVEVGKNVSSIGESVFYNCTRLESAGWNNILTSVPNHTFYGCTSLRSFVLPESVRKIGNYAFYNCKKLTDFTWNSNLGEIGDYAFQNCAMTNLLLPAGITKIGSDAFYDCDALTSINIPGSVTEIGTYIFGDCDKLTDVTLGTGLRKIPDYAFTHCDELASVVIPYRVTEIGEYAFANCVSLTSVTIPRNVAKISKTSFNYPDKLTVYGVAGTYAQTYAEANFYTFIDRQIHAAAVTLSKSERRLNKGTYFTLSMAVDPENFTDKVTWKSSNTSVATVNDEGRVTGVGLGEATISVVVGDAIASYAVTVIQPVTSISLNRSSLTMDALRTSQLTASVSPSTANNRSYEWQSSDETAATVDANGLVTAWRKGTAVIRAVALDGSGISGGCTVTVSNTGHIANTPEELQSPHIYPDNCSDIWSYTVPGAEYLDVTFDARTEIEKDFDYLYIYTGDWKEVGKYTGTTLAGETLRITGDTIRLKLVSDGAGGTWGFGFSSIAPYIFTPVPAEGMRFDPDHITLGLNTSTTLIPVFTPNNTTNQEVTWESSNKEVAIVSLDGVVTALCAGTAVITATSEDGGFTASVTVRVESKASLGDVSGDGAVDAVDAMLILRSVVGLVTLDEKQRAAADVNGDGKYNTGDSILILRYDAGLITKFPAEK